MRIAILGWGSLIESLGVLNINLYFGENGWQTDGPVLPIEFSRISGVHDKLRYLSLVISPSSNWIMTLFAESIYTDLNNAICNLANRESTAFSAIGYFNFDKSKLNSRFSSDLFQSLEKWNENKNYNALIWTDLDSNFESIAKRPYTIENVQSYLKSFTIEELKKSIDYIRSAPSQTETQNRSIILNHLEKLQLSNK